MIEKLVIAAAILIDRDHFLVCNQRKREIENHIF
jgi:hypothetical protein